MADVLAKDFIVNTDDLNRYGFRILTAGIQIDNYNNSPIVLWNHIRSSQYGDPKMLPIGQTKSIKKLPSTMVASIDLDKITQLDKDVVAKVESGTLRTTSIGVIILEISTDPQYLVQGQSRPTVTKCDLIEISVTDIPANAGCVMLSYMGKEVWLSSENADKDLDSILPLIQNSFNPMKQVLKTLGLSESATEIEANSKVLELQGAKLTLETELKTLRETIINKEKEAKEKAAKDLVQLAIDAKKIPESMRASWEGIAMQDYNTAKASLDSMQGYSPVKNNLQGEDKSKESLDDKALYAQKWKEAKLKLWQKENPEEFKRCYLAYFGTEYKAD